MKAYTVKILRITQTFSSKIDASITSMSYYYTTRKQLAEKRVKLIKPEGPLLVLRNWLLPTTSGYTTAPVSAKAAPLVMRPVWLGSPVDRKFFDRPIKIKQDVIQDLPRI